MFPYGSQNPVGGLPRVVPPKRTRVPVACVRCRKRKVKCSINEENLSKPCAQCVRGGVVCEYMSIDEERAQSASVPPGEMPSLSPSAPGPSKQIVYPPSDKSRPITPVRQRSQPSSPFIPANANEAHRYGAMLHQPSRPPPPHPRTGLFPQQPPTVNRTYSSLSIGFNPPFQPSQSNLDPRRCVCPPGPCRCGGRL
ncbi:hypothetical protein FB451DRAFT_108826 [Mycena latifolia]|nr:hypothetical protein FB451DRAFT_108826 [Mycena latifolia]